MKGLTEIFLIKMIFWILDGHTRAANNGKAANILPDLEKRLSLSLLCVSFTLLFA